MNPDGEWLHSGTDPGFPNRDAVLPCLRGRA